jgi:hypothetical protein
VASASLSSKRSRAGKRGADRRWNDPQAGADAPPVPPPPPSATCLSSDDDPEVARRLKEYIGLVGMPADWGDIKTMEQVRTEIVRTMQNTIDLQTARGRIIERSELKRVLATTRDVWWASVQQVCSDSLASLAALPVDQRAAVRSAIDAAVSKCAERVRDNMATVSP